MADIIDVADDSSSSSSQSSTHSVPFENVTDDYDISDMDEVSCDSGTDSDSPSADTFSALPLPPSARRGSGRLVPPSRMPKKEQGFQHESFRDRKKKEMRHGSFTYKQISDDATPTAHRKQLFSKRSACM